MNIIRQQGISLVELMVSMTVGIVISLFIVNIMGNSARIANTSTGISESQENGRFVISWLQERVRLAGYIEGMTGTDDNEAFISPICPAGTLPPPNFGANCSFDDNNNPVTGGDRLAIRRHIAQIGAGEDPNVRIEHKTACDGTLLAIGLPKDAVLVDLYWVERNVQEIDGDEFDDVLYCITYNDDTQTALTARQVVANGIEGMQVLYLLDTRDTNNNFYPDITGLRYVNASELQAAVTANTAQWNQVLAVKIAVLTREFNDLSLLEDKRSYILLDAEPYTFEDQVSRYIQQTVVHFPNKDYSE